MKYFPYANTATELQNWLLFYSIPILDGVLPQPYFLHFCKLVRGVSILLSANITPDVLEWLSCVSRIFIVIWKNYMVCVRTHHV